MVRGLLLGLLFVGACVGTNGEPPASGEAGPEGLAASVEANVRGDSVLLKLHVTNTSDSSVPFTFPSSQRYDFQVRDEGGEILWTWSATRSFAQVVTEAELAPSETWEFEATWNPGGPGRYQATGWLTEGEGTVRQSTSFEVP